MSPVDKRVKNRPSTVRGRFCRNGGALVGLIFVSFLALAAYLAPLLANNRPLVVRLDGRLSFPAARDLFPFNLGGHKDEIATLLQNDPDFFINLGQRNDPRVGYHLLPPVPYSPYQTRLEDVHEGPSFSTRHYFGCDDNGRDILSRMLHGAKVSLLVGFLAVGVATLLGLLIGGLAGFAGGWLDTVIVSRMIEVMMCFPVFFLILTVVAVMDPKYLNIWTIMLIIGLTSWTGVARYARAEFMRLRDSDFVTAGRALGVSPFALAFRHILPNALTPLIIGASFGIADVVLQEASISFLGVGVQPPDPSWGNILNLVGRNWGDWWLGVFPGLAIFLTVISYNLIGEGLRDALDPKLVESR